MSFALAKRVDAFPFVVFDCRAEQALQLFIV